VNFVNYIRHKYKKLEHQNIRKVVAFWLLGFKEEKNRANVKGIRFLLV